MFGNSMPAKIRERTDKLSHINAKALNALELVNSSISLRAVP